MDKFIKSGFTGDVKAYDRFCKLYNDFADRLEELGADDSMFSELQALCEASRMIYPY